MIFKKQYSKYTLQYRVSHVCLGGLSFFYNPLVLIIVFYQSIQYICGVRFYLPEKFIASGCNTKHYINKLAEHCCGYILIWTMDIIKYKHYLPIMKNCIQS